MQDICKVFLIGRLTKDVGSDERSFGYLQNGTCKAQVSIAVNESKKSADGQWQEYPNYFEVTIWGKTAENLKPYLLKGSQIAVEGRLRQDRWQDAQGNNKSRIVINAETVQLVGGKKQDAEFNPQTTYPTAQAAQKASSYAQQYQNQQNGRPQFTTQNQPASQNFNGQPFQEDIPSGGDDYPSDIPF